MRIAQYVDAVLRRLVDMLQHIEQVVGLIDRFLAPMATDAARDAPRHQYLILEIGRLGEQLEDARLLVRCDQDDRKARAQQRAELLHFVTCLALSSRLTIICWHMQLRNLVLDLVLGLPTEPISNTNLSATNSNAPSTGSFNMPTSNPPTMTVTCRTMMRPYGREHQFGSITGRSRVAFDHRTKAAICSNAIPIAASHPSRSATGNPAYRPSGANNPLGSRQAPLAEQRSDEHAVSDREHP